MLHSLLAILPFALPVHDSLPIDTANIVVVRRDFAVESGFARKLIRNTASGNSLTALLAENGVYIKQYGVPGLAAISLRGADPQQTQVLWNGIPVANPMAGIADLNTFGIGGTDDVTIIGSGASSFYGSGNVGGSLLLSHGRPVSNGFATTANMAYSTYGMQQLSTDIQYKKNKAYIRNSLAANWGAQEFAYKAGEFADPITMKAAGSKQLLGRVVAGADLKKWELKSVLEYSDNVRNLGVIPGADKTLGTQWDRALRGLGEARRKGKNWNWTSRVAFFNDYLRFRDTNTAMDDTSRSRVFHAQTDLNFLWRKWRFLAGADVQHVYATTEAYGGAKTRIYPANFLAANYAWKGWKISANGRFEWYEKVPVGALRFQKSVGKEMEFYGSVHNSFRRPALNDLFWDRQDNAALLPERGVGAEAGASTKWRTKRSALSLQFIYYLRSLKHPIIWMPGVSGWEAVNLLRGDYRGFELHLDYRLSISKYTFGVLANVDHVNAQMTAHESETPYTRIFIPGWNGNVLAYLHWKNWKIIGNTRYTGSRYITTDNSDMLPGFFLTDVWVNYSCKIKKVAAGAEIGLGSENLFNKYYVVMPGRPMPLRGYKITIKIYNIK